MPDCGVHYLWFAFVCFLSMSHPGYCLVGKIPHPPPGGGIGMGGWVGPKFQHFGPPAPPPPPPGGAGALFGGFGFVQGSEISLNFSLFFFITFQAS